MLHYLHAQNLKLMKDYDTCIIQNGNFTLISNQLFPMYYADTPSATRCYDTQ